MTLALSAKDIARQIEKKYPGCVAESAAESLLVKGESLLEVAGYLKTPLALTLITSPPSAALTILTASRLSTI